MRFPHIINAKKNIYLKEKFNIRGISITGDVNLPSRSSDLTLLDYLIWGYIKKGQVNKHNPQVIPELK